MSRLLRTDIAGEEEDRNSAGEGGHSCLEAGHRNCLAEGIHQHRAAVLPHILAPGRRT